VPPLPPLGPLVVVVAPPVPWLVPPLPPVVVVVVVLTPGSDVKAGPEHAMAASGSDDSKTA
jgi:hypothetical protein